MAVLAIGLFSLVSSPTRAQDDAASLFKSKCAACHGADGSGNGALQTTSVAIYLGAPGSKNSEGHCTPSTPGIAGVLFLNSDVAGQPKTGADTVLLKAFQSSAKTKT